MLVVIGFVVVGDEPEDVPVDIEDILEVSDLVFEVIVLLPQQLLQTHG
jgi:hypothetical protein